MRTGRAANLAASGVARDGISISRVRERCLERFADRVHLRPRCTRCACVIVRRTAWWHSIPGVRVPGRHPYTEAKCGHVNVSKPSSGCCLGVFGMDNGRDIAYPICLVLDKETGNWCFVISSGAKRSREIPRCNRSVISRDVSTSLHMTQLRTCLIRSTR